MSHLLTISESIYIRRRPDIPIPYVLLLDIPLPNIPIPDISKIKIEILIMFDVFFAQYSYSRYLNNIYK